MIRERLSWAKNHIEWTSEQWDQVVFSDESIIRVMDDRVLTVRRWLSEEFMPECLKKTVTFPQKIMVWRAISVHGTSFVCTFLRVL